MYVRLICCRSGDNIGTMTRKIFFFVIAAVLVGALLAVMPRDITTILPAAEKYYVFCRSSDKATTDNGISKVVETTNDLSAVLFGAKYVDGVTAVLPVGTDVADLLQRLQAEVLSANACDDIDEYLCYSPRVRGGVFVDGQRVNVQIAVTDTAVYVGSPLILGAY